MAAKAAAARAAAKEGGTEVEGPVEAREAVKGAVGMEAAVMEVGWATTVPSGGYHLWRFGPWWQHHRQEGRTRSPAPESAVPD